MSAKILRGAASSLLGSYSSSSSSYHDDCPGIPLCLLLALFAGLAAMFRVLCIAITMKGRRKKRSDELEDASNLGGGVRLLDAFLEGAQDLVYSGRQTASCFEGYEQLIRATKLMAE
jgi:hypothetical protein